MAAAELTPQLEKQWLEWMDKVPQDSPKRELVDKARGYAQDLLAWEKTPTHGREEDKRELSEIEEKYIPDGTPEKRRNQINTGASSIIKKEHADEEARRRATMPRMPLPDRRGQLGRPGDIFAGGRWRDRRDFPAPDGRMGNFLGRINSRGGYAYGPRYYNGPS